MEIYKAILNFLIAIFMITVMITGCSKIEVNEQFPLDVNGYPIENNININGKNFDFPIDYDLDKQKVTIEYSYDNGNEINIFLAQGSVIHDWVLDPTIEGIELLSKDKYLPDKNKDYKLEGTSPYIERYRIKIKDKNSLEGINFKKVNVNFLLDENGSKREEFSYSESDYVLELKVKILHEK